MNNTQENFEICYNILIDNGVAKMNEVDLVCDIMGNSIDTLQDILYVRTGYRTFEQYMDEEGE